MREVIQFGRAGDRRKVGHACTYVCMSERNSKDGACSVNVWLTAHTYSPLSCDHAALNRF